MKGMTFKEGQTPMKNINTKAFKASAPGSSKEELLEISEEFVSQPEKPHLDYGGYFEFNPYVETYSGKQEEEEEEVEAPKQDKKKKEKPKTSEIKSEKKEKKPGDFITLKDIQEMNKKAKVVNKNKKKKKKKKKKGIGNWISNLFKGRSKGKK